MHDPTPRRRNFEASATDETLLSTLTWTLSTRRTLSSASDFHTQGSPEDPGTPTIDRTISEPRDLYVTDVPNGD
jgi:hypothetical protein